MSTLTDPATIPQGAAPPSARARAKAWPYVAGRAGAAYVGLLVLTAFGYLWTLSRNGYGNEYYAAAVQAASTSWKAWFFGSLDASSFITVDKTPASLWVMGLSGRIFGFSSWSMLIPQALMGVATVALVYAAVRRWFNPNAALIAGIAMAVSPVAVLMFRFNNPDALLVLLLVAGAYAVMRAIDSAKRSVWWMTLAGVLVGLGFLTKMLQAFLVLPAFGLAYLIAGQPKLLTRIWHSLVAVGAMIVGGGWWIAIVELLPASSRPYIGGSQNNSIIELTLGYNGLGRLTGNETGSVGGGTGTGGWGGATGLQRLFGGEFGSQVAWLLPAALIATIVLVVAAGRAPRTDRTRAFVILWGGWLLVTGLTFSYMQGIIHNYYMIALSPAIAALVGPASVILWRRRSEWLPRATLAGTVMLTAGWAFSLLAQASTWNPWLRYVVLAAGLIGTALVLLLPELEKKESRAKLVRRGALLTVALIAISALSGPTAYSVQTIGAAHAGAIPTAGPSTGMSRGGGMRIFREGPPPGATGATRVPGRTTGDGGTAGVGGFLGGGGTSSVSSELVALLQQGANGYTWAAAAVTANGAAPLQLASGVPVMSLGGFNGTDPAPTLAQFQELVAQGKVHYFIGSAGGMGGAMMGGRSGTSSEISTWVTENFTAQTIGGTTVYDLTK